MEQLWTKREVPLDLFGENWGSFWDQFGIGLGSVWNRFEAVSIGLGSVWNRFGVGLGSVWNRLGSVWNRLWAPHHAWVPHHGLGFPTMILIKGIRRESTKFGPCLGQLCTKFELTLDRCTPRLIKIHTVYIILLSIPIGFD